jgi:alpha-galactosidase
LGSDRRSSEQYLPFVSAQTGPDTFFGGIMWSGAWRITSERASDGTRMRLTARFPESPFVSSSHPIEVPHAFFGVASPDTVSESAAIRQFILTGVRRGRPYTPLVTYNTWFPYGTTITEDLVVEEIDRSASVGVELFVVDAGWYIGAGRENDFDFESGLGGLTADPERFPSGLASLADYTHDAGMKFGLWVEPERVALDMLSEAGVNPSWLATHDGQQQGELVGQVCLSGSAARQWLVERLTTLIAAVRPDYLKWDNNGWINCNREGHDHGPNDGNFAHVTGLYDVLTELRTRFPALLIENVSGGGNRLDFGIVGLTDAAWMDDRSWPSSHVRHNLEGLSYALPPAYLLSFVIAGGGEEIDTGNDLAQIVRSRMPGILGMTFRGSALTPEALLALSTEVWRYRAYRSVIAQSSAALLSGQAPLPDGWDVLQETADDGLSALVFAFKGEPSDERLVVHPRGLRGDLVYDVESVDGGLLGSTTGDSLMSDGIELVQLGGSIAHVLVLTARPQ